MPSRTATTSAVRAQQHRIDPRDDPGPRGLLDLPEGDPTQHDELRGRTGQQARDGRGAEHHDLLHGHRRQHRAASYADDAQRGGVHPAPRQLDRRGDHEAGDRHQQHEDRRDEVEAQGQGVRRPVEALALLGVDALHGETLARQRRRDPFGGVGRCQDADLELLLVDRAVGRQDGVVDQHALGAEEGHALRDQHGLGGRGTADGRGRGARGDAAEAVDGLPAGHDGTQAPRARTSGRPCRSRRR